MSRWEFHLSVDETGMLGVWTWRCHPDGGDIVVSKTKFASYRECIADALLHGYRASDVPHRREPALTAGD